MAWAPDRERKPEDGPVDQIAVALRRDMEAICDASMPRAGPLGWGEGRRNAYWWTAEIAELRTRCTRARRRFTRARRKRSLRNEDVAGAYWAYSYAR